MKASTDTLRSLARIPLAATFASAIGCGVTVELAEEVPPPHVAAVLPFAGPASPDDLATLRGMLREQLRVRNVRVVENDLTDRILSEHEWLTALEQFDPGALSIPDVCEALGVESVIVGTAFDTRDVSLGVFLRKSLGGRLEWYRADGQRYWTTDYDASWNGGLLVHSGQIITALEESFDGSSRPSHEQLAEEYLHAVLSTLPELQARPLPSRPPVIDEVQFEIDHCRDDPLIAIEVVASPKALVTFDLANTRDVPTFEYAPGRYRGFVDVQDAAGWSASAMSVRLRDAFGEEIAREPGPVAIASLAMISMVRPVR